LKDAITKEPKRYELHLKLLEMYAGRKDTSAFEAIAGELYTTLGADDPTWLKVAEIGHSMEPENPLYDVSKVVVASSMATQKLDAADFADVPVSTDTDLDFSFDADTDAAAPSMADDANSAVMQSFSTPANVEEELSFDLGSLEADVADSAPTNSAPEKQNVADNSMDFDLGSFNLNSESQTEADSMKTMDNLSAFGETMPGNNNFEAPAFDLPIAIESSVATESKEADVESFNMDFNLPDIEIATPSQTAEATPANAIEEISFDLDIGAETSQFDIQPDTPISEISFDLPQSEELETNNSSMAVASEFDLSSISLDLGGSVSEQPSPEVSLEPVAQESADVDIKLDLVAAYIDMDDKEGARELLQEVVKEGGPQQQKRAKELLSNLA
jgi:pilus assembly protein FimV